MEDGRFHPLAAVYRTSLVANIDELLESGHSALLDLITRSNVRLVEPTELADLPSPTDSLQNVNTPEEYAAALVQAGFAAT